MPPPHPSSTPRPPSSSPPSFTRLKSRILTSLSTPSISYTDASPKGSLDTAIVPLINRLNALEGVVTTSSCAGRVSVFLEGRKGGSRERSVGGEGGVRAVDEDKVREDDGDRYRDEDEDEDEDEGEGEKAKERVPQRKGSAKKTKSVPGGKGLGGRWLFVSHDPVKAPEGSEGEALAKMLGLSRRKKESRGVVDRCTRNARYVRFAFEPMILHIATASLAHASRILSAAISAGFRESGVQSLKNLTDPNALPMVAVRSAGLAFESIIGVVHESRRPPDRSANAEVDGPQAEDIVDALVDEQYLEMLVETANERFKANTERMNRFEEALFGVMGDFRDNWEAKATRQDRKRKEGLRRKEELKADRNGLDTSMERVDEDQEIIIGNLEEMT